MFVVAEPRTEDVLRRNDAFERRLNDLLRCGRDDVEVELVALRQALQRAGKQSYVMLQPDALSGLDKMLAADTAKVRIMQNQIAELRALLHQIHVGKALDLVVKIVESDELTQHDTGVVEAERLVKITGQQELLNHFQVPSSGGLLPPAPLLK